MTEKTFERILKYGVILLSILFLLLSTLLLVSEDKFDKTILSLRPENLSFNKLKIEDVKCKVKDNLLNIEITISSIYPERIYLPKMIFFLEDENKKILFRGERVVKPLLDRGNSARIIINTPHLETKFIKLYFIDMDGKPINCKTLKIK